MKKHYLLAVAAASLLLATGCQKDQELVTLGAEISQPAKTYIDNRYPCWNEGDEVYVNSAVYPVSAISGSSAQIVDVVGADAYRAIFPASLVAPGSNIETGATIPVALPATQKYQVVGGHQRVDAPMGAYTDGGTLQFYNLCSIVHVVVNNNTGSEMTLGSLKMETANAMLSGTGTATVNGTSDDGITLTSDASHSVSLRLSGATNVTLAAGAQSAFDIYVPSFATDNVTLTLYTTDGYYYELTKSNVALRHNTYTTVTLNVDQLTQILAAELVDGPTFNAAIPDNATAVEFEYNSSVSSGTVLSTANSPVPIYGNLDGTTWRVSTSASMMNANPDCSWMFQGRWDDVSGYLSVLRTIDFGEGFNTANVTDMRWMFEGCSSLTSLNLSNFNTANVTDMTSMFGYCSSLTSLDLSNFNTENVTYMGSMFDDCMSLTSLDLSNFNTANVTDMNGMFFHCISLTSLNLSNFNTANVTDMGLMFESCSSLTSLDLSNFNTANVTDMYGMFFYCSSLTSLNLSNFYTANVTDMGLMFESCSSLTSLDLSNFNTANVTYMSGMFFYCSSLTSLNLSHFDMSSITDKTEMCGGLATTSRACTITCPVAVQTELENGTGLPTSGVAFTWLRPTSK
jgi:surface protein